MSVNAVSKLHRATLKESGDFLFSATIRNRVLQMNDKSRTPHSSSRQFNQFLLSYRGRSPRINSNYHACLHAVRRLNPIRNTPPATILLLLLAC